MGAGLYRLDRNLAEPNWDGSYAMVTGVPGDTRFVPGGYASVGFDSRIGPALMLGVDASCHQVAAEENDLPSFSTFTIGTHFLFGW